MNLHPFLKKEQLRLMWFSYYSENLKILKQVSVMESVIDNKNWR